MAYLLSVANKGHATNRGRQMYTHTELTNKYPLLAALISASAEYMYPSHDASYLHAEVILAGLTDTQIAVLQNVDVDDDELLASKAGMQLDAVMAVHRACLNASGL